MRKLLPILLLAGLGACQSEPEDRAPNAAAPAETLPAPEVAPSPSPAPEAATPTPAASESPAVGRVSRYTSLDECQLVRSAPEEAGFFESTCPGLGGYRLTLVEADGRHNLMIVADDTQHNLRLPSIGSGGFSELGKRIEWRGREEDGRFRPDALILRYAVVENPDQPSRPTSYLLSVSLAQTPCLSAKIAPGADQNARARAVADGPRRCL
ncbi:hypothetical protein ACBY01_12715 [Sphingomonas sp. ac-8]|uniref:hypothetical protein n=1 Tax=Sphingomonas sp. ac-8 TaxID=3242977 RepID=UPI003A8053B5